jgi:membrane protein
MPFFGLLRTAWQEYERDHARYFAGAMVYYALVSLLPLLLLLLAALGLLLRSSHAAEQQVLNAVENSVGTYLRSTVEESLERIQQESVVATAVALVGLLLTSSVLFRHLRLTFRAIWKYTPPLAAGTMRTAMRITVVEYLIALVMVMTGGVLLLLAIAMIAVTQWLGRLVITMPLLSNTPARLLALPGSLLIVGLTFALLLKFLPPVRLPWRHVWLAALLCTAAWIIGAEALVLSGAILGKRPSASGAMGGLLLLMFWTYGLSQMLFFGAEVCKVLATRHAGRA